MGGGDTSTEAAGPAMWGFHQKMLQAEDSIPFLHEPLQIEYGTLEEVKNEDKEDAGESDQGEQVERDANKEQVAAEEYEGASKRKEGYEEELEELEEARDEKDEDVDGEYDSYEDRDV
jgi:hypothetical protein